MNARPEPGIPCEIRDKSTLHYAFLMVIRKGYVYRLICIVDSYTNYLHITPLKINLPMIYSFLFCFHACHFFQTFMSNKYTELCGTGLMIPMISLCLRHCSTQDKTREQKQSKVRLTSFWPF